jgi:hypothetical protein
MSAWWARKEDRCLHACARMCAGSSGAGSSGVPTPSSSLMRHPDRGAGFYRQKRERYGRASLIETGRRAAHPFLAVPSCMQSAPQP